MGPHSVCRPLRYARNKAQTAPPRAVCPGVITDPSKAGWIDTSMDRTAVAISKLQARMHLT